MTEGHDQLTFGLFLPKAMKTFTKENFFSFVLGQPDNAPVNMNEARVEAPCGCLLAQFGKSLGLTTGNASMCELWYDGFLSRACLGPKEDDVGAVYNVVHEAIYGRVKTFGQAKKLIPTKQ